MSGFGRCPRVVIGLSGAPQWLVSNYSCRSWKLDCADRGRGGRPPYGAGVTVPLTTGIKKIRKLSR
jgi:hypothetical protein